MLSYLFAVHDCQSLCSYFGFDFFRRIEITLLLAALLVLRGVTGLSLVRIVSPAILCLTINMVTIENLPTVGVIFILLLVLSVGDVLSNINMDFSHSSITSETLNFSKIVHPLVLFYGILATRVWVVPYSLLVSGGLFTFLAFIKNASMMRSSTLKELTIRLYFLLACDHFIMFAAAMLPLPVVFQWVAPPLVSQLLY